MTRCPWCGDPAEGDLCESCRREAELGPQGLPQMPSPEITDLPRRTKYGPNRREDNQPLRFRVVRRRI